MNKIDKKKIVVVGSSNVDFVMNVTEMPQKGETLLCQNFANVPGGKGANQACACGKLGGDCIFLTVLGRDSMGQLLHKSLEDSNVDLSHIGYSEVQPSGMAMITVNSSGENSIIVIPGANSCCDSSYFKQHQNVLQDASILLTQLEIPLDSIYSLIIQEKELGKTTILNPAPAPESIPENVLQHLDWITPNETELAKITGYPTNDIEEIEVAAKQLIEKGVKNVLVTIGSKGALLCRKEGCTHYATKKVKAVDTTAAGDTFNGALAVALSEGMPIADAIKFSNIAASISVTRKGAQTSIPSREEVDSLR